MSEKLNHLYGVVICQDSTAALWPLSTADKPLEFEVLPGAKSSLFAQAVKRLAPYVVKIVFAANANNAARIKSYIEGSELLEPSDYSILTETYQRGTALTLAMVAAQLREADQQAVILAVPLLVAMESDERWKTVVQRAYRVATTDRFALVGSTPASASQPSSGGRPGTVGPTKGGAPALSGAAPRRIIKPGVAIDGVVGAHHVRAYIDAPLAATLYRALEQGALDYSGVFAARATLILNALKQPALASYDDNAHSIQRIAETARFLVSLGTDHWATREAKELLATLPDISLEQATFDTAAASGDLVCVPTGIQISSYGSLAAIVAANEGDRAGNVVLGAAHVVDAQNTFVMADSEASPDNPGKTVVALGVSDLVIIETEDAVLVAAKDALNQLPGVARSL